MRQGGVQSLILFTVYLDDLLQDLERAGPGCYWRHHFVRAVCYADDVALLAPFASALRLMLNTCVKLVNSHSLTFNAAKTVDLFQKSISYCKSPSKFCIHGEALSVNQTVRHLGHIISHDLSDSPDISDKSKDLIKKANYMLHTFSSCDKYTKTKLFQSIFLSLPGCAALKLSYSQLKSLEVTFNNIPRKMWGLPRWCHTSLVHLTATLRSVYYSTLCRSLGLYPISHFL